MKGKILFAGGCHVDGTVSGGESTLSRVALHVLNEEGFDYQASYLIQMRLIHPRRLIQKCDEVGPHIVVLQAGHPETSNLFRNYLTKRLGLSGRVRDVVTTQAVLSGSFDSISRLERMKWLLRSYSKAYVDSLIGHRLLDTRRFDLTLNRCLERLRVAHASEVLILSPLPCIDPVPRYYRELITPLFCRAADRHGFEYLDMKDLQSPSLFADPLHLNTAGHLAAGEMVGKALLLLADRISRRATRAARVEV